jgi:hypothetical protein
VPLAPLEGVHGVRMLEIANKICSQFEFSAELTFNTISTAVLEAVMSVSFDKTNLGQIKKAHECIQVLHQELAMNGYYPYRLPLHIVGDFSYDDPTHQLLLNLKNYFDPAGIISPGRYGIFNSSETIKKINLA